MVYHDLVEALDGKIEALSIEDCHCKNDLELFEKFKKTTAIVGFVDISVSKIEVVDEVVVIHVADSHNCRLSTVSTNLTILLATHAVLNDEGT